MYSIRSASILDLLDGARLAFNLKVLDAYRVSRLRDAPLPYSCLKLADLSRYFYEAFVLPRTKIL
jgi:hypothetical protein